MKKIDSVVFGLFLLGNCVLEAGNLCSQSMDNERASKVSPCVRQKGWALIQKKESEKEGARLLAQASAQGDRDATKRLGWLYLEGIGVPKNKEKGLALLRHAAFGTFVKECR